MATIGNSPQEKTVIRMEARKSFSLGLLLRTEVNAAIDVTNAVITLVVSKRNPDNSVVPVIDMTAEHVAPAAGHVRFEIQASDTDLEVREYYMTITMRKDGYSSVLAKGVAEILPNTETVSTAHEYDGVPDTSTLAVWLKRRNVIKIHTVPVVTKGNKGDTGGGVFEYAGPVGTGNPGPGKFSYTMTPGLAVVSLSAQDVYGSDLSEWYARLDGITGNSTGTLSIHGSEDDITDVLYVSKVIDRGSWVELHVSDMNGETPVTGRLYSILPVKDGERGRDGDKGGVRYDFDMALTREMPSAGTVRFNSTVANTTTSIFISNSSVYGTDVVNWLRAPQTSTGAPKGAIQLTGNAQQSNTLAIYDIYDVVAHEGWTEYQVTHVSGTMPVDEQELVVQVFRTADFTETRESVTKTVTLVPQPGFSVYRVPDQWNGVVPLAHGFRLYRVAANSPCRIRLYSSFASRDADYARWRGTDPGANTGLLLDVCLIPEVLDLKLSPLVDGISLESRATTNVAANVERYGTSTDPVTFTLYYLRTERRDG